MSKIKKFNIKLHDVEAKYYDVLHQEIFNIFEQQALDNRFSLAVKNAKTRKMCLDLGCGTGNITKRAIGTFDFVVGLDLSQEMLKLSKFRFRHITNLVFILGDCEHLPLKSDSFDFVTMFSVLHHLPSPCKALLEINRVLKKSGIAYIDHEPNFFNSCGLLQKVNLAVNRFNKIVKRLTRFKGFKKKVSLSCLGLVYSKTDIWKFSPRDLSSKLKEIGFKEINVNFHFLYSKHLFDLPSLLSRLSYLDKLLDKLPIIRKFSHTIIVTARK